jgi:ABC-type sugar transport system ATPase subunit
VREPRAFLLDEPLSNLDPRLRVATRTELALLHRRLRTTMVYVTHDQEEAMTLGMRVAVMRAGAIEQVGAPMEIFDRPCNTFVAAFVGTPSMNLIACTVADAGSAPALRCGDLTIATAPPVPAGTRLTAGIRPHDLHIVPAAGAGVIARVEVRQSLGSAVVLHVRPSQADDLLLRVLAPAEADVAEGATVGLHLRPDRLHYFSADDGRRLDVAASGATCG